MVLLPARLHCLGRPERDYNTGTCAHAAIKEKDFFIGSCDRRDASRSSLATAGPLDIDQDSFTAGLFVGGGRWGSGLESCSAAIPHGNGEPGHGYPSPGPPRPMQLMYSSPWCSCIMVVRQRQRQSVLIELRRSLVHGYLPCNHELSSSAERLIFRAGSRWRQALRPRIAVGLAQGYSCGVYESTTCYNSHNY
jgi:hypothetical protein